MHAYCGNMYYASEFISFKKISMGMLTFNPGMYVCINKGKICVYTYVYVETYVYI